MIADYIYLISIPIILILIYLIVKVRKHQTKNNIIKQPKMYVSAGLVLSLIGVCTVLIARFFMKDENKTDVMIATIVFLSIALCGLTFMVKYINWEIMFTKDEVIIKNMFRRKKVFLIETLSYEYIGAYIIIYDKDKSVLHVSVLFDYYELIFKNIKLKTYHKNSTGMIKGSVMASRFGIAFLLIGLFLLAIFPYALIEQEHVAELIVSYVILALGLLITAVGLSLIAFRYVWKLTFNQNDIIYTNIFGIKKTIKKENLTYKITKHGYKVFLNGKRMTWFNENMVENQRLLYLLTRGI